MRYVVDAVVLAATTFEELDLVVPMVAED